VVWLLNFDNITDRTTIAGIKTASGADLHSAVADPILYGTTGANDGAGAWTPGGSGGYQFQ